MITFICGKDGRLLLQSGTFAAPLLQVWRLRKLPHGFSMTTLASVPSQLYFLLNFKGTKKKVSDSVAQLGKFHSVL